jgi:hypothetical protein
VSIEADTAGQKEAGATEVSETNNTTPQNNSAKASNSISKEELSRLLEKVRSEEKTKLYPELEKAKGAVVSLEKKIAELTKQGEKRQKELEGLRSGESDKAESINRELKELRENNQRLSLAIEEVSKEAAERVRKYELASYRERKLREAGIKHLSDLVRGDSEEAIDLSIADTKNRESALYTAAREEARRELAKSLPTPISPEGSKGRGPTVITPEKKEAFSKLRGDEYAKVKSELLAEAKAKAGIT